MSRLPDLKFSVKKNRQISSSEARFDTLKKGLSTLFAPSGGGSSKEEKIATNITPRSSYRMQKNKDKQAEGNGDERRGNRENKSNSSDNHPNEEGTESQSNPNFDAYTEFAKETFSSMSQAHKCMKKFSDMHKNIFRDIEEVTTTKQKYIKLQEEKKEKEKELRICWRRIGELDKEAEEKEKEHNKRAEEKVKELAKREAAISKERDALDERRQELSKKEENAIKRAKLQDLEHQSKLDKELQELRKEQEKSLRIRMQQLEQEAKEKEDKIKERLTSLEAKKNELSTKLKEQKDSSEKLKVELTKAREECDDQKRAKISFKEEKEKLERQLERTENEFALGSQPEDFYKKQFLDISENIEKISSRHFSELPNDDSDSIREKLARFMHFKPIPITRSSESQKLRIVFAQCVISYSLTETIWQSFSSEKTLRNQEFLAPLREVYDKLWKIRRGRAPRAWAALAMMALESLSPAPPSSLTLASQAISPPPFSRAQKVVKDVLSVLRPLVSPSKETQLRNELLALANSAISVWAFAQRDELKITICPTLDRENRSEWRSKTFDPLTIESGNDTDAEEDTDEDAGVDAGADRDADGDIFIIFPRIVAQKPSRYDAAASISPAAMPGTFPQLEPESEQQEVPELETIVIHKGTGIPGSSPLMRKGEEERQTQEIEKQMEDRKRELERLQEEMEMKKKELQGSSKKGRKDSAAPSSGPTSPTTPSRNQRGFGSTKD